jgi:cell division septum initiation protein DivIVA
MSNKKLTIPVSVPEVKAIGKTVNPLDNIVATSVQGPIDNVVKSVKSAQTVTDSVTSAAQGPLNNAADKTRELLDNTNKKASKIAADASAVTEDATKKAKEIANQAANEIETVIPDNVKKATEEAEKKTAELAAQAEKEAAKLAAQAEEKAAELAAQAQQEIKKATPKELEEAAKKAEEEMKKAKEEAEKLANEHLEKLLGKDVDLGNLSMVLSMSKPILMAMFKFIPENAWSRTASAILKKICEIVRDAETQTEESDGITIQMEIVYKVNKLLEKLFESMEKNFGDEELKNKIMGKLIQNIEEPLSVVTNDDFIAYTTMDSLLQNNMDIFKQFFILYLVDAKEKSNDEKKKVVCIKQVRFHPC